ncbi:MAG TPA: hypothetical protein VFE62_15000 [Gemmataceae bacterium]|nr:hypothetical protein [Gemmataceae bacterium]
MFRVITCVHCGTRQKTLFRIARGQRIRCQACGHQLNLQATEDLLRMQGLMRMGDDDGGGGDWGGGGGDDHGGKEESGEEDDDEEEEEDDGKGGKKKKAKSKTSSGGGGFFQRMLRDFIGRVITTAIAFALLACCCTGICFYSWLFPNTTPFVGIWEGSVTVKQTAKVDTDKQEDKKDKSELKDKKEDKDKKDLKDQKEDVEVPVTLVFNKIDEKNGTGTLIFEFEDGNKTFDFKWRDHDKDKKQFVMEMDNKDAKFWKDIKSPATFTYAVSGNSLTLTADGQSMTFNKPAAPDAGGAPKKGGGGGGGGGKRKKK